MNTQAAYQQYKEVQVNTANSGKLLIMLYQGAIKFLRLAKKYIYEKNLEGTNQNLLKAQTIINELRANLDQEIGGDIAQNLDNLYQFMNRQLIEANIRKDTKPINIVEGLLIELLETWQEIVNVSPKQEKTIEVKG